ncbi:DUF6089 family protein [Flavobacterium sp.]|uniref:type IX secretion system protein PorG n=1 Tax=Flavobacterium sp. TaxID=239 RepID=UPI00260F22B5|nr:DUF6089 family protein [Flavobacterium sp.]
MKRFFLILFVFGITNLNAQIHEIGGFLGGSNYIGDIGKTNYINPNEIAFGLIYKWNRSPRHAWRFSLTQANLSGDDAKSGVSGRKQRGYKFENSITEFSAGLEFNFFDFNLHQMERKMTPYVYTGVSYFVYNELFIAGGDTKKDYGDSTFAIPMIVGVKSNITRNLILGAEVGVRYTLTDNLDGSNPKNENLESFRFGNLNSNDWYVFSGLTLTYTFGEKPCYCAD